MHIVIIHQFYLMPGSQGGSRFNEMARMWSQAGHQVTVVAGNVDYVTGTRPERYKGRWITKEKDGDVHVLRCHVMGTYSKSYFGRALAFFGFTLTALIAGLLVKRPDVVIATSPPLVTPIPGWATARLRWRKARLIFEVRDLWPESAITTGVISANGLMAKILYACERWACKKAEYINVLTPAFREDLIRRGLAPEGKISVIPNGADIRLFSPGPGDESIRKELGWDDRIVFMYAGAHGRANALHQLVDAAERMKSRPDILIACVGDGPERKKLQITAKERGLENIVFLDAQPKDRMPALVRACDVGVAVLQNNPTFRTVYPNKVFDYMSCERPTVLAIDGVARQLVCEQANAGLFAEPENADSLAEAMTYLADHPGIREEMGKSGRQWVLANASREALAGRYLEVLEDLVRSYPAASRAAEPAK